MTINRLAKGRRLEAKAMKWYQTRGWKTYRPPWNRWGEHDVWGWGDFLCRAKGREPLIVQVRDRSDAGPWMLARDGKDKAAKDLEECGFRVILLMHSEKPTDRVPKWEERAMLSDGTWVRTFP